MLIETREYGHASVSQRFLGACWTCVRDHAQSLVKFLGLSTAAASTAVKVYHYTVSRIPSWNTAATLGIGGGFTLFLEARGWPLQTFKPYRQASLMQALVLYEFLTNIYLNLPQNEDGSPTYPLLNELFLNFMVALAGSFVVMRVADIFGKNLNDNYVPLRSESLEAKSLSENPTKLIFEPSTLKACLITQGGKITVGSLLMVLSRLYPNTRPYTEQLALLTWGHAAGCLLEEGSNAMEKKLEANPQEESEDPFTPTSNPKLERFRTARITCDVIAALTLGPLFTSNNAGVFPLIGAVTGYIKARTKRDFEKGQLPRPLEPVILKFNLTSCRIPKALTVSRQTLITSLFLATVMGWYAWGIESGVKGSKQGMREDFLFVELTTFVGGIFAGIVLTTLIERTKRVSLFCNSARFYAGPGSAWLNVLTLYFLQQLNRIGNYATQNKTGAALIAPGAAWGCLGLALGNNLSKSTRHDLDPALVTNLITRFLFSLFHGEEQL